jgi:hypothetical protein
MKSHACRRPRTLRIVPLETAAAHRACVKAALAREIAWVPLFEDAPPDGPLVLVLTTLGLDHDALACDAVEVRAEPFGEPSRRGVPMRLSPVDDFGEGALLASLARAPGPSPSASPNMRPSRKPTPASIPIPCELPSILDRDDPRSEGAREPAMGDNQELARS